MRVTFVLPMFPRTPIGGVKVVYLHANGLRRRGHEVTVLHSLAPDPDAGAAGWLRSRIRELAVRLVDRSRPPWFDLDPGVRVAFTRRPEPEGLPDGDVVVATAWQTAPVVAAAPDRAGRGAYLIQHYETWSGPEEEVRETWRLPLHKVVISRFLKEIAVEMGEAPRTSYVPYGVEREWFRDGNPPGERPERVGMFWSEHVWKGSADGLEAIRSVRGSRPGMQAVFFGIPPRPAELPDWVEYVRRPDPEELADVYHSCSVYLHPSWSEGWGLTATEAMACGCALVTTDCGGSRDYAFHGETALVVPPRAPDELAGALERVLEDDALRRRLASAGRDYVEGLTWERSTDRLEEVFRSLISSPAPGSPRS